MLFFCLLAALASAEASVGSNLGFSSRAVSLGGAMVGSSKDGASAWQNPAALSSDGNRLDFHWGILYLNPEFTPIDDVVVENDYTSDISGTRRGTVDTEYPNTFGQSLGLSYQYEKSSWKPSLGFITFLPLENLALLDTGESYVPEYTLQRSRNQRPEFDLGLGLRPASHWSMGVGLHLGAALNANTTAFLQTNAGKTSSMRVTAGLKTKAAPYLGTQVELGSGLTLGLVIRFPLKQRQKIKVSAAGQAIGTVAAIPVDYDAIGVMSYDPLTVETGAEWDLSDATRFFAQLDYQAWSNFESPQIQIEPCSSCGGVNFAGSASQSHPLRDVWVPRLGVERQLSETWALRLGYSFKPSIYSELPSGAGNPLDPDEHRLGLGLGKSFGHFLDFDTPCRLDLHASYHRLVSEHVTKTPGNEAGSGSGDQKIGAPGYDAGGYLWGGGLSLEILL